MVFIVYKGDVYKEYVLPNIDNTNYDLRLDKGLFALKKDVELHFDVNSQKWTVFDSKTYKVRFNKALVASCELQNADIIFFETSYGERFTGIVAESENEFRVMEKFSLSDVSYLSIGEGDDNIISYGFNDLVSKHHCELRRNPDGFYVEDYSKNGVFLNNKKIPKHYRLNLQIL